MISRRGSLKLFGGMALFAGQPAAPDLNALTEYFPAGATDNLNAGLSFMTGKVQRDGTVLGSQRTAVLPIFGQSNNCNVNPSNFTPVNPSVVDNFNIYNGGTYAGTTPLLGCSTSTLGPGNPFIRLADSLITGSVFDRVIVAPAGIGATTMNMWGADQFQRVAVMGRRLAAAKMTATAVLYQQGETDNGNGTSQASYAADLALFIAKVRLWHSGPIFIARSSWASGAAAANVTNAQVAALTNIANGIWSLGNMDSLTGANRQADGTHLSDAGAAAWAALMVTALHAYGAPF